ncbi:hypothetical protein LR48_Vigan01g035800 [Vigna angularis]|uniref:Uncharacterized protein n=1 Tax=Phaseolus angularis TaxID=3914 RepID=A0A0L9TJK5_PHAAN|nr:hypothetical protein LR48_Vigan01g035800 [Vigna angularis]
MAVRLGTLLLAMESRVVSSHVLSGVRWSRHFHHFCFDPHLCIVRQSNISVQDNKMSAIDIFSGGSFCKEGKGSNRLREGNEEEREEKTRQAINLLTPLPQAHSLSYATNVLSLIDEPKDIHYVGFTNQNAFYATIGVGFTNQRTQVVPPSMLNVGCAFCRPRTVL